MFSTISQNNFPQAVKFVSNAIKSSKLANSYIVIGKDINAISVFVQDIAKILNCKNNKTFLNPCNECINCKWLNNFEHPQALISIIADEESKKEQIKIDAIRDLLGVLNTSSEFFRVIFFQNANLQNLPQDCCNLLLKTVEETPERTLFIFCAASKTVFCQPY